MSTRIGLGVGRDAIRVVLVCRGRIIWSQTTTVGADDGHRMCVERALRSVPRKRGRRHRVVAAVGPSLAQLKSLASFPAANDRVLGEAVSANAGRFFLRNGIPLCVTGVRRDAPDCVWVAAMEAPVIRAIEDACRGARVQYSGAVPVLAVLRHAIQGGASQTFTWHDNDVAGEVEIENGRLVRASRVAPNEANTSAPALVDALKPLGADGWLLADAYAVAVADPHDPLILRPTFDATLQRRRRAARRGLLVMLSILFGLAALFAPGVTANRARAEAAATLIRLAPRQREVTAVQNSLAQITRALQRGADFAKDRPQVTRLIASITQTTPEMTAVLNLRIDSMGGSLLALSPKGAEVFAAVSQLSGITAAQITAPLTRETLEAMELERVAIRFQFQKAQKATPRKSAGGSRP